MTTIPAPEKKTTRPTRDGSAPKRARSPRPKTAASEPRQKSEPKHAAPKLAQARLVRVALDEIAVGERRRKAVGDVSALARSIAETGVLEPILVDEGMRLVDGYRRLLAARELGLARVPALVVDLEDPILAYVAVNGERKRLTGSERFAVAEELLERAKDPEWRGRALGGRLGSAAGKGRLDEFVARHVGLSRETLRKIRLIHERAREDEARFGDLVRRLDEDGRVDRWYRELQRRLTRDGAEAALAIVVEESWTELEGKVLAKAVREADLASRGDAGCLLLVPTPVALVGAASGILSLGGYRWVSTLAGGDGRVWAVGVLGKRAEIDPAVADLLAQGCAEGTDGARVALEAALGVPPLAVALGEGASL